MLLYNIGDKELTAGELRTRGYYLGSNVSYNLKKLVEMGYLDHQRSRVDRRSVRIRLTDIGREVRDIVEGLYQKHVRTVEQVGGISADEFATLNKSLHRLERFWTDQDSLSIRALAEVVMRWLKGRAGVLNIQRHATRGCNQRDNSKHRRFRGSFLLHRPPHPGPRDLLLRGLGFCGFVTNSPLQGLTRCRRF